MEHISNIEHIQYIKPIIVSIVIIYLYHYIDQYKNQSKEGK